MASKKKSKGKLAKRQRQKQHKKHKEHVAHVIRVREQTPDSVTERKVNIYWLEMQHSVERNVFRLPGASLCVSAFGCEMRSISSVVSVSFVLSLLEVSVLNGGKVPTHAGEASHHHLSQLFCSSTQ